MKNCKLGFSPYECATTTKKFFKKPSLFINAVSDLNLLRFKPSMKVGLTENVVADCYGRIAVILSG